MSALDGHRPTRQKGTTVDPVFYEPEVVEAILREPSTRCATGARDLALLTFTWRAALRANCEALALDPGDISGSVVRVRNGKGGKARSIQVSAGAIAVVDRWLACRRDLGLQRAPLFCTLEGRRMSYPAYDAMFKRRAAKAHGPDFAHWHLHALRASRAVELERAGTPLAVISTFLGHANVATTSTYLRGLQRTAEVAAAGDDGWSL
jgi:site-specific recombinase XerD